MSTEPSALRRLACRLNLWHRWHTTQTDDGERFVECKYCLKEDRRLGPLGAGPFSGG